MPVASNLPAERSIALTGAEAVRRAARISECVSFLVPDRFDADDLRCAIVRSCRTAADPLLNAGGEEERAMPYCITLRARTDTRIITGWYAGRACRWSTDHHRRKVFDNRHDARAVCHELRSLCPRNAKVINIEEAQDDRSLEMGPPMFSPLIEPL